jgi:HEAT repeat protein
VPLKRIAITGRDANQENWLSDADVAEAIAAERWLGDSSHAKRTTQQLLAGLSSWSPAERFWSAQELGRRQDNVLPQLLAMIKRDDPRARLGAVMALGQLKARAVPALDTLAGLLNDDDRWLRVQAAEALRTIGEDAKPVLPQMLKAAVVKDETDQMEFAVGALAYALFYPGGAYGPRGILAKSIDGISKDQLYPAIRSVAANPDSHARGCLRSTYALLTLDDAKALAPTIVASIKEMAPANTMFSKGVRLAGIQAMARLRIEEGIPLTMMMLNLRDWGRAYIILESLDVLKQYGGAAKSVLPELRKLEVELRGMKPQHDKIIEVIAVIENDKNPPKLISLKDYLGNDMGKQPPSGQAK